MFKVGQIQRQGSIVSSVQKKFELLLMAFLGHQKLLKTK